MNYTLEIHYLSNDIDAVELRSLTPLSIPEGQTINLSDYAITIDNATYSHASYARTCVGRQVTTWTSNKNEKIYFFYTFNTTWHAGVIKEVDNPYSDSVYVTEGYMRVFKFTPSISGFCNIWGNFKTLYQGVTYINDNQCIYISNSSNYNPGTGVPTGTIVWSAVRQNDYGEYVYTGNRNLTANTTYYIFIRSADSNKKGYLTMSIPNIVPSGTKQEESEKELPSVYGREIIYFNIDPSQYSVVKFKGKYPWLMSSSMASGSIVMYLCLGEQQIIGGEPEHYILKAENGSRLYYQSSNVTDTYYIYVFNTGSTTKSFGCYFYLEGVPGTYLRLNLRESYDGTTGGTQRVNAKHWHISGQTSPSYVSDQDMYAGTLVDLSATPRTYSGTGYYKFLGWYDNPGATGTAIGEDYLCSYEFTASTTLYACYETVTDPFDWDDTKTSESEFLLTADEWNRLRGYAFSKSATYNSNWPIVQTDDTFTADLYNVAATQIGTSSTVSRGDIITAALLNELKDGVNS